MAGVGGEGFNIAALPFGVDGVKGERGFAGAGKTGDDCQRVARDRDVDVLEIMLTRAADGDVGNGHEGIWQYLFRTKSPVNSGRPGRQETGRAPSEAVRMHRKT